MSFFACFILTARQSSLFVLHLISVSSKKIQYHPQQDQNILLNMVTVEVKYVISKPARPTANALAAA
jgi:hypothetical protein